MEHATLHNILFSLIQTGRTDGEPDKKRHPK